MQICNVVLDPLRGHSSPPIMEASSTRPGRPFVSGALTAMTVLETSSPPRNLPVTPQPPAAPIGASPQRWKWTGDDLIRMGEAGLLPPEARFELLDGEIYQLMAPVPFTPSSLS